MCVCVCVLTQPFHALMLLACLLAMYCCECSASSSWQIAVGASGAAIVLAVVAILIVMKRRGTGVTPSSSSSAKVRGQHTTRGSIPSCEYSFLFCRGSSAHSHRVATACSLGVFSCWCMLQGGDRPTVAFTNPVYANSSTPHGTRSDTCMHTHTLLHPRSTTVFYCEREAPPPGSPTHSLWLMSLHLCTVCL